MDKKSYIVLAVLIIIIGLVIYFSPAKNYVSNTAPYSSNAEPTGVPHNELLTSTEAINIAFAKLGVSTLSRSLYNTTAVLKDNYWHITITPKQNNSTNSNGTILIIGAVSGKVYSQQ